MTDLKKKAKEEYEFFTLPELISEADLLQREIDRKESGRNTIKAMKEDLALIMEMIAHHKKDNDGSISK